MDLATKKIFISRDVVFNESVFPFVLSKRRIIQDAYQTQQCSYVYENDNLDYDELTDIILNEENEEEAYTFKPADGGKHEQDFHDDEYEHQDGQNANQNLPRRSSKASEISSRSKDYMFDIPGKRST